MHRTNAYIIVATFITVVLICTTLYLYRSNRYVPMPYLSDGEWGIMDTYNGDVHWHVRQGGLEYSHIFSLDGSQTYIRFKRPFGEGDDLMESFLDRFEEIQHHDRADSLSMEKFLKDFGDIQQRIDAR